MGIVNVSRHFHVGKIRSDRAGIHHRRVVGIFIAAVLCVNLGVLDQQRGTAAGSDGRADSPRGMNFGILHGEVGVSHGGDAGAVAGEIVTTVAVQSDLGI